MPTIIPYIRARRLLAGLTLEELAERAALDPGQLDRLERNQEVFHFDDCIAISLVLHCQPTDLFEIVPHI